MTKTPESAEVVVQLVEVSGSNPVIGKKYILNIYCQLCWIDEIKDKPIF